MPFELLQSDKVYRGKAFHVRQDRVRAPDGQVMQLDIVEHVGAVTVIPWDEQGRIWFVRQYRHAAGRELLELPAGTLEAGEDPEDCAWREIREETGLGAGRLVKLGEFFLAPGYSSEYMHVYLATDLYPDPLPGDVDEFLSLAVYPLEQVAMLVNSGELQDAKSLAALLLARNQLGVLA